MASTSSRTDLPRRKNSKPLGSDKGFTGKAMKTFDEWMVPKTPIDAASYLVGGKAIKVAVKAGKVLVKGVTSKPDKKKATKKVIKKK